MRDTDLENLLRDRGLELLGPCERLSECSEPVQQSQLMCDFTPEEADQLGASMLRIRAQPGQLLLAEGESSDWMMILLSGTVDVGKRKVGTDAEKREPGGNTRLAVLKEGAVIGEMSMLDGQERYASCWALSEVEAALLTRAAVVRLIDEHPAVGAKLLMKITELLAQQLRNTSNQLLQLLRTGGNANVPIQGIASAILAPSVPPPAPPGSSPSGGSSH